MLGFDSLVTFCYTSDLGSTARFYEDVLGLPLALDQGTCRIYRVAMRAFLGFCRRPEAARPDGIILTLVAEDVDGWATRLLEKGVTLEKPPAFNPAFNIYHCFFRDPNGYLLEIQRFEDPRWPAASREP